MKRALVIFIICAALAVCLSLPVKAQAEEGVIKIGAMATLEGPFTVLGQDGMRGIKLALKQWNNTVAGKKIELIGMSTDSTPESATRAVRKLVEQDKVDIVIGPLSGSEGIAVKDYAKTQPKITFLNGVSAAQDTTLRDPAPNFFRFTTDGAQWTAGLGEYVYNVKGYKKIVTIAEDYSFPYTNVLGFLLGYCKAGGKVVERFWVPLGNKDYSTIVASIPEDIDAIFVALGGSDAVNFLSQYEQAGGSKPMIGGSITADQSVMGSKGHRKKYMIGTATGGPIADSWDDPRWRKFVDEYKAFDPKGFPSPSLFCYGYYVSTLACLTALDQVKGDLSNGQKALQETLAKLELQTPTGLVKLDENRQAIADIFLTEIEEGKDGNLYNKVVKIIPQVNQALGMDRAEFLALGPVGRDNPPCK
jgi:branched-chain amino acid transport system substrate-binding protein